MRYVSEEICGENQNTVLSSIIFFLFSKSEKSGKILYGLTPQKSIKYGACALHAG